VLEDWFLQLGRRGARPAREPHRNGPGGCGPPFVVFPILGELYGEAFSRPWYWPGQPERLGESGDAAAGLLGLGSGRLTPNSGIVCCFERPIALIERDLIGSKKRGECRSS